MKNSELVQKNQEELCAYITEQREALHTLRFQTAGSGMRNTRAQRNLRHNIARGLTELNRRTGGH